jgi:carotenoid cleavage dioxygenase
MASRRKDQGSRSRSDVDQPSRRLGLLEDELAIRRLHETYEICLDSGFYEDVVDLFTEDGEVAFNGGVFDGRGRGVRRLYVDRFRSVRAGKRIEVPPGSELDARQQPAVVTVATDRKSAQARFAYSIQVGAPIVSDSQLARMARLHGEGILRWWEGGTYVASYAKDVSDGGWRMRRLEFQVQSRAAHGRGRSGATPIPVPVFSKAFPEDPAGPDRLVSQAETSQNA